MRVYKIVQKTKKLRNFSCHLPKVLLHGFVFKKLNLKGLNKRFFNSVFLHEYFFIGQGLTGRETLIACITEIQSTRSTNGYRGG